MANVFISYSHKDELIKNKLEDHFSALISKKIINIWQDRLLLAGSDFDGEIKENINNADIILLLMSSNFMKSKYCSKTELPIALERHRQGEAVTIGVIVSPCQWQNTPIARYVSLPKDAKPITKHGNRDDAYLYIVNEVERRARIRNKLSETVNSTYNKVNNSYSKVEPLIHLLTNHVKPFLFQNIKILAIVMVLLFFFFQEPQTETAEEVDIHPYQTYYHIKFENVNFRSTMSTNDDNIIRIIPANEAFLSYEQDRNGWWSIRDTTGVYGYIHGSTISAE